MTIPQAQSIATLRRPAPRQVFRKYLVACLAFAGALGLWLVILTPFLANKFLTIRDVPEKADVIVVLGGDGPARAELAAGLWLKGFAPRVLVTGDGDCYWIRSAMVDLGVSDKAISVECQSGTTWENALFSAPILKHMSARTGIVVTSWYASRRAIASFDATSPEIRWLSVPVESRRPAWKLALGADTYLQKEFPKAIGYALRGWLGLNSTSVPPPFPSREVRA